MMIRRLSHACASLFAALLWCSALACTTESAPAPRDSRNRDASVSVTPIDSAIPPAVAGTDGWNYSRTADVNLTGDSLPERVVLTARVELYRGQPAWDDGQPWQVYVEHADSSRTYLYAAYLQLGTLEMRVANDSGKAPSVLLVEQLPQRLRILETQFDSSDRWSRQVR